MSILITALLLPSALVSIVFAVEVIAGIRRSRAAPLTATQVGKAVVVVPAHDEEAVIEATLIRLGKAAEGLAKILVVADNCTDGTASVSRKAGAMVAERHDQARRGKGFALAHARDVLASDPPDVVVVLDADCWTDRDSLAALIAVAHTSRRPAQAINLLEPAPQGAAGVKISTFAFMLKNLVRQRGLQRLAGRVHLTGTGMALPWTLFEGAKLATADIVEDIKLGIELAAAGTPPQLVSTATVWSPPADAAGTLVQRQRWEGGYLATMRQTAPSAVRRSLRTLKRSDLAAALNLCVPPLALLAVANAGVLALAALLNWFAEVSWWPVLAFIGIQVVVVAAILGAWAREGRDFLSGRDLLRLPMYVLWKLPMYAGFRRGTPSEWLRTGR